MERVPTISKYLNFFPVILFETGRTAAKFYKTLNQILLYLTLNHLERPPPSGSSMETPKISKYLSRFTSFIFALGGTCLRKI